MLLLSAVAAVAPIARAAQSAPAADPAALAGREALAVLAARSYDPDPEVRAVAAAAWGQLKNSAAIPRLKKALSDANADVRIAAAASLVKLGDVQGLTALIDETKAIKTGPSASPAEELRRMARDSARARAVLRLGETGRGTAVAALRSALADQSGEVRDAAAVALARLNEGSAEHFVSALKDSDEGVRVSAARALGLIGRDGLEGLKKAVAGEASASVRAEAAAALGGFSDPGSLPLIVAALSDKSARVRVAAARGLARRVEPASTAALKKLLEQGAPPETALIATAALAARGEDVDLSLPELTLGQKDPDLKSLAISALAASLKPEARELLVKAMRGDDDPRVRTEAAAALLARTRRAGGSR